jgi:hypothetical protein
MNTVTFIYKKKNNLCFLNLEDALIQETNLKKQGWKHIATIDPAIFLTRIYDVCQEEYSSDEKVDDIIKILMSS